MTPDSLTVWLDAISVAVIGQRRGRLHLTYTAEALGAFPPGTPVLSMALLLTSARYSHGVVSAFLDGLLPEGEQRRVIAQDLDISANDTYALTQALGRECAGALIILPSDEPPPTSATTLTAQPLDEAALGDLVANLRNAPLGISDRVRLSLAGVQEKLLLSRMPDGSWGLPIDGTPSTHILKPEIAAYPDTVENEAFCMRLARHLGLSVANIETTSVNGRKLIVVERYDRVVASGGNVTRLHQEDFCQALGIPPDKKYQEDGGPSLRRVAQLLDAAAEPGSVESLLRATTLNVLIGNGDAHGKNFSLLHDRPGVLRLAPLYDVMSTLIYGQDRLAMRLDKVTRTSRVTGARIVAEAATWGLSKRRAAEIVADVLDRAADAVAAAASEAPNTPTKLLSLVQAQSVALRDLAVSDP